MELRDTLVTIGKMLPFLAQKVIICKICILLSHVCVRLMSVVYLGQLHF